MKRGNTVDADEYDEDEQPQKELQQRNGVPQQQKPLEKITIKTPGQIKEYDY